MIVSNGAVHLCGTGAFVGMADVVVDGARLELDAPVWLTAPAARDGAAPVDRDAILAEVHPDSATLATTSDARTNTRLPCTRTSRPSP